MHLTAKLFTPDFWVNFWHDQTDRILHSTLRLLGVILVYLVLRIFLFWLLDGIMGRMVEKQMRLHTLQGMLRSILGYTLFFVFAVQALDAVGVQIMPFVEAAGVMGLAIGFGAQKLVKDMISGFFLIVDSVFTVGEMVTIGTVTGEVVEMGMRVTSIKDPSGRLYIIPNGDISTVTNLSRNPISDTIEITVSAYADLDKIRQVVQEVGDVLMKEENNHLKALPKLAGITTVSGTTLTLQVSVSTDQNLLWGEKMRLRFALLDALHKAQVPLA